MSSVQAILTGAILIAVSILFVNSIRPAAAQFTGGPFQLVHHSNTTANAGVFKINTETGEVSYCFVSADANLVCSRPVR